jgi:signal transduction histidine kinase
MAASAGLEIEPGVPLMRPAWHRYGGVLVLTLFVVIGRYALNPWWGEHHNRHLVFLPTVMVAAWFGGFWPGVLASALSSVALYFFWPDAGQSLWYAPSSDLVLFAAVSVAVCRLIDSLQRARAHADAATRSREHVLQIVAHDLKNPLNAVKMTTASVARAVPEVEPKLERIDRAVLRMESLIQDLVDTTRIERGELTVSPHAEAVAPLIQEAIELFSSAAQERGVTLEAKGAAEGARVNCDRERILQVLSNFVGNALKYTKSGGRIDVTAEERPDAFQFSVADTGRGIDAEHLPHIFDQYWKLDSGGTGLGLFIARSIVLAHGGRIWVDSRPEHGATFYFTLPR